MARANVAALRRHLKAHGSRERAAGIQWFFKEEVRSYGWRTADLRRFARETRKEILRAGNLADLVNAADKMFSGDILEEKVFGVLLLAWDVEKFGEAEFRRFCGWLDRVSSWADHDGLVHYLIGPMIADQPRRQAKSLAWTRARDRWHRRAAAVSLIHTARLKGWLPVMARVSDPLIADPDDMVQKGVSWLLREAAKADPRGTLPYLMKIRGRATRLVLRTACEKLTPAQRAAVLAR